MKHPAYWLRVVLATLLVICAIGFVNKARANDLPLAAASPLSGVAFDDKPLLLPVQRNFQMAMLTAGSELGRSCGKMEAYGWRMNQTEQARVNQIFNNTVDRLRLMGYTIQPQTLTSVSNDITLFTADGKDKHFLFLWSAGELGLVMNLCETSAPLVNTYHPAIVAPSVQVFPVAGDVVSQNLAVPGKHATQASSDNFTPLGEWVGGYICHQGYTGGALEIDHLDGKDFAGKFKFYPTPKNPDVARGAYEVYGQYDKASGRILINPGKWISRPPNYFNTVLVGSFDPVHDTFSAYFQGISGCTSFEAKRAGEPYVDTDHRKHKKPAKKSVVKKKKPVAAAKRVTTAPLAELPVPVAKPVMPVAAAPAPAPMPASVPAVAAPAAPAAPVAVPPPPAPASEPAPIDSSGITLSAPGKK